jgi:hypothetical protein
MEKLTSRNFLFTTIYSVFFISFASKGFAEKLVGVNLDLLLISLFLLVVAANAKNIYFYIANILIENYRALVFWIISLSLFYFLLNPYGLLEGLSFLGLFILVNAIFFKEDKSCQTNIENFLRGGLIASIFFALGILIGFAEYLFFDSSFFHNVMPLDYPNPLLNWFNEIFRKTYEAQIFGFSSGINYSAYVIITGLFLIQTIFKKSYKTYFVISILLMCLILTNAKVGVFFIILLILNLFRNRLSDILVLLAAFFYILLCHFTFHANYSEIVDTTYFFKKVTSFGDIDIYLSLFSFLKLEAISYLLNEGVLNASIDDYAYLFNNEPHSLFISILFFAGPVTLILFILFLFRVIKIHHKTYDHNDYLLNIVFVIFLVESIVWDAYDSPFFWMMIFIPKYKEFIANISRYY